MLAWVVSTPVDLHDIKSCGFCICAMVGHEIYKTYLAWVIIQEAKDPEQVLARGSGGRHIDVRPERPAQEVMRDYRITAPLDTTRTSSPDIGFTMTVASSLELSRCLRY
jgi:hypothetical protein